MQERLERARAITPAYVGSENLYVGPMSDSYAVLSLSGAIVVPHPSERQRA